MVFRIFYYLFYVRHCQNFDLFSFRVPKFGKIQNCRFVSKVRQIKMLNPLATHHVSCSLDLCDSGLNLFRHLWNHWQLGSRHLAADNKTAHQNKENLKLIFNFFFTEKWSSYFAEVKIVRIGFWLRCRPCRD